MTALQGILTSFSGTLLALATAGVLWLFKVAYQTYRKECLAIAKIERALIINDRNIQDNFVFIREWMAALGNGRPYSFHWAKMLIDEDLSFDLRNLKVIRSVVSTNYMLKRSEADVLNIYTKYWEALESVDTIPDTSIKEANLKHLNDNVLTALKDIVENYKPVRQNIIDTLAIIRVAGFVKRHSLFGYINKIFFSDIFPQVSEKRIEKEKQELLEEMESKSLK